MKRVFRLILLFQVVLSILIIGKAQGHEKIYASICTMDGKVWKGKMDLPYVNSESVGLYNKIYKREFRSSDIEKIYAWQRGCNANTGIQMMFLPSYEYKSIKDKEAILNDQSKWMVCLAELDNISLFMVAQQYDQSRYYVRPVDQLAYGMPPNNWLYVLRKGEIYPTRISLTPDSGYGSNQHFREVAQNYFSDCPELCDLIQAGIYTNQYIVDAVVFYNDWKTP